MKFSTHLDVNFEQEVSYNPVIELVLIVILALLLAAHLTVVGPASHLVV
jgi:hypothetical protein